MKKLAVLLLIPALSQAHNVAENIKIMPLSKMEFPSEMKKKMQVYNLSQKKIGYVQIDNEYTRKLMLMNYNRPTFKKTNNPEQDELKKNISDVPLNFTYKSILPNTIAYTALGMETNGRWSGIKEFFDGKEIGVCTLSIFNISKAKQDIQLNEDGISYDVNDKPTRIGIEGSNNSGFMYSVRWYDAKFVRDLECANMKFDKEITTKMVSLASQVDNG
jgi:hypothetical protein